jgi:hypothetical protein
MLTLWAKPQGFLKAAMANNATITAVNGGAEVSFTLDGKYRMVGFIIECAYVDKSIARGEKLFNIHGDIPRPETDARYCNSCSGARSR